MATERMGFDFGHNRLKSFIESDPRLFSQRSLLAEISEGAYRKEVAHQRGIPAGFYEVSFENETRFYVLGYQASGYLSSKLPDGAMRYTKTYYGAALAIAMSELIPTSAKVEVSATHPPKDIIYSEKLEAAALGKYTVKNARGVFTYNVTRVLTVDEPLAAWANVVFNKNGMTRKANPLHRHDVLVIDMGGRTTDFARLDANGNIVGNSLKTVLLGMNDLLDNFESALRDRHSDVFISTPTIDVQRLEAAFNSGTYKAGKKELDMTDIVTWLKNDAMNQLQRAIDGYGGANFDDFLLCGGGGVAMKELLAARYPDMPVVMSHDDESQVPFAQAYGAAKIRNLIASEAKRAKAVR